MLLNMKAEFRSINEYKSLITTWFIWRMGLILKNHRSFSSISRKCVTKLAPMTWISATPWTPAIFWINLFLDRSYEVLRNTDMLWPATMLKMIVLHHVTSSWSDHNQIPQTLLSKRHLLRIDQISSFQPCVILWGIKNRLVKWWFGMFPEKNVSDCNRQHSVETIYIYI